MEAALEGDEDEEQRLIEERRRRRQQILAKHHQDKELSGEAHPASSLMRRLHFLAFLVFSMARDQCMQISIRADQPASIAACRRYGCSIACGA